MSTSTTSLPQLDLAAADQPGDVVSEQQQQQQQEQSMDFSKPPLKKTGSASSASPTEDESHSTYHDSFLVDELAVVGSSVPGVVCRCGNDKSSCGANPCPISKLE